MTPNNTLDINSRKSIASIIYLAVISVCVFIIQPGIVQGFVTEMQLTPSQAGYVASAEMWGMAAATVLLIYFADRIDWRKITAASLIIATVGNFASILDTNFVTFSTIRAITGLGLGAMITLPFAMLGLTQRKDYNYGLTIVWLLAYGALGLYLIPSALNLIGLNGIFIFLALFCGCGLFVIPNIPRGSDHADEIEGADHQYPESIKWLALGGVLIFDIAIGAVWAYLFLVGLEGGIEEQTVANILTFSQVLGMMGALLVVYLSHKISREKPMILSILGCAVGIGILLFKVDFLIFSAAIYIFNFWWNIAQPYLMATLASFNDKSKTVVRGSCMQMLGFAIGPYLAATIIDSSTVANYDTVNLLGAILFISSLLLLLPGIVAQRRNE